MFQENDEQISPGDAFRRMDESADEKFYDFPRFGTQFYALCASA